MTGEILQVLANLSVLTFVITSMLALGLSLTVQQIIGPLRNVRLVGMALLANFVLAPLVAYLIMLVIPLDEPLRIGLICLATAAGAPFLPKLVQAAKGDIAMSVGLMVLLMVVTVVYVPLVLPLLLQGVTVDAWAIARSLIVLMLIPLAIGLFIKARYADTAASLQPVMAQTSSMALILLFVLMLALNVQTVIDAIGTGALLAALVFIALTFAIGYFLAGSAPGARAVLGLGTAQRNVSAALVVAGANFTDPNVLVMILVGALLMLAVLMPAAGELGKRQTGSGGAASAPSAAQPAAARAKPASASQGKPRKARR
jgi:BASS family bile acid:Na+ symporter